MNPSLAHLPKQISLGYQGSPTLLHNMAFMVVYLIEILVITNNEKMFSIKITNHLKNKSNWVCLKETTKDDYLNDWHDLKKLVDVVVLTYFFENNILYVDWTMEKSKMHQPMTPTPKFVFWNYMIKISHEKN